MLSLNILMPNRNDTKYKMMKGRSLQKLIMLLLTHSVGIKCSRYSKLRIIIQNTEQNCTYY